MIQHEKAIGLKFVCGAICAFNFMACDVETSGPRNDLGLTLSDLKQGELADVEVLRTKTKAVADAYLAEHESELRGVSEGPYTLALDSSLSPKIGLLGYRSSFYYFCWDIYLQYSIKPTSGRANMVIVQLSDRTPGNTHDPDKFRVLRALVIDQSGLVVMRLK